MQVDLLLLQYYNKLFKEGASIIQNLQEYRKATGQITRILSKQLQFCFLEFFEIKIKAQGFNGQITFPILGLRLFYLLRVKHTFAQLYYRV